MISGEAPLSDCAEVTRCKHVNSIGSQRIAEHYRMPLLSRPASPPQIITSLLDECFHAVVRTHAHFLKDERQTRAIYFPRLDIDHR